MPGITRICPICKARLTDIHPGYVLREWTINNHRVATIGSAANAAAEITHTVEHQIASNLAAYDLDYDAELNLGFMGTAWVQCPQKRETVTPICIEKGLIR